MKKKSASPAWEKKLEKRLPLLGHRNWIVVADSAYPWQTAPGIEMIQTGSDHLRVIASVLSVLETSAHVRPILYTDAELPFLAEEDASGIRKYRDGLGRILKKREAQSLPHEQIIGMLDEAGRTFQILILKTNLVLPYTSLFMRLDCGYWTDEAEKRLRRQL